MTREEALKHLEEWKERISSAYRRTNTIACLNSIQVIDMAIEALSAPDGDLISRADAICEVLVNDGTDNIVDRIEKLPSAVCDDCIWTVCNYNKVDWDTPPTEAVIRCKDCRYYNPIDECKPYPCSYGLYMCNKDDYCSYGKRKGGDTE